MKPKLTPVEVNRLLRQKASIERKLIFMREYPPFQNGYSYEIKVTNKQGDKIIIKAERTLQNGLRKRLITNLKWQLKWINSDLGIFTNIKYL